MRPAFTSCGVRLSTWKRRKSEIHSKDTPSRCTFLLNCRNYHHRWLLFFVLSGDNPGVFKMHEATICSIMLKQLLVFLNNLLPRASRSIETHMKPSLAKIEKKASLHKQRIYGKQICLDSPSCQQRDLYTF